MPKFNESEKAQVKSRLLKEGERLFAAYGLKKVSIDEIVSAVPIAKATFYTFYDSKEALFLDIVRLLQLQIFKDLDTLLLTNASLSSRQRVHQVFASMYDLMSKYPVLSQLDKGTACLIARKVSTGSEPCISFFQQNLNAVYLLVRHGITLNCPPEIASHTFLSLYQGWLSLQHETKEVKEAVTAIMLNGVIDQLIED